MRQFKDVHIYGAHLKCVHLKVKRYECGTCGHASYKKDNVKKHQIKLGHVGFITLPEKVTALAEVERAIEEKFANLLRNRPIYVHDYLRDNTDNS